VASEGTGADVMARSEYEEQKRKLMAPVLIEAGAALIDCQGFEYGVALVLHLLSRNGNIAVDPADIALVLDGVSKKTAGQLVQMLRKHVPVEDAAAAALDHAIWARNHLVHRVMMDNIEKLQDEKGRNELINKIDSLRAIVRKADNQHLRPIIKKLALELDGDDLEAFERRVLAVIAKQLAE
jgi:hypothetical protein